MSIWLDLGLEAYDVGKDSRFIKRMRTWMRRKKHVLILGASGAGKTQFVHALTSPLCVPLTGLQRTVAVNKKKIVIDEYPFLVYDTPGQLLDEAKRKQAIMRAVRGGFEGIINVACFGFHEAAEAGNRKSAAYEKGPHLAKGDYLQARRKVEIELLSEWAPLVDEVAVKWVLTVVTKADLWWPDTNDHIKDHYENGPYAAVLDDVTDVHSVVPFCSVIEPFYGTRTGGRFGDRERVALRGHLLDTLLQLSGVTK